MPSGRLRGGREGHVSAEIIDLVLSGGLEDVPRSRAFTRQAIAGSLAPSARDAVTDDAVLVVTELVTNALLHGGPPVRLRLRQVDDGVRLEVADGGADAPVTARRSSVAMTGRGLALVDALSRSWGVDDREAGGKTVWAEVTGEEPEDGVTALAEPVPDALVLDDEAEMHVVELGAVPTDLLLEAKSHIDNLVREFTLEAASADESAAVSGANVPPELAQLVATVVHGWRSPRSTIKRQALEAAQRGEPEVHLALTLPASAAGRRGAIPRRPRGGRPLGGGGTPADARDPAGAQGVPPLVRAGARRPAPGARRRDGPAADRPVPAAPRRVAGRTGGAGGAAHGAGAGRRPRGAVPGAADAVHGHGPRPGAGRVQRRLPGDGRPHPRGHPRPAGLRRVPADRRRARRARGVARAALLRARP